MKKKFLFAFLTLLVFCSFPFSVSALPIGLVSYWQFDDGTGAILTDETGNNDGEIDGATWENGLVGGSLKFDGINDIVRLTNTSGYGNFSMTIWFRYDQSIQEASLFQTGMGYIKYDSKTSDPQDIFRCLIHNNRQGGTGNQTDYRLDVLNIDLDENWHYAAMTATADNGSLKAYMDGEFIGDFSYQHTGWSSALNYSNIGALKVSGWPGNQEGDYFSGWIDEVAQFDRALSSDEIDLYYRTGLAGRDLYNPVPIPGALWLLVSGLIGIVWLRGRHRS